jgi:hypothetical protein
MDGSNYFELVHSWNGTLANQLMGYLCHRELVTDMLENAMLKCTVMNISLIETLAQLFIT